MSSLRSHTAATSSAAAAAAACRWWKTHQIRLIYSNANVLPAQETKLEIGYTIAEFSAIVNQLPVSLTFLGFATEADYCFLARDGGLSTATDCKQVTSSGKGRSSKLTDPTGLIGNCPSRSDHIWEHCHWQSRRGLLILRVRPEWNISTEDRALCRLEYITPQMYIGGIRKYWKK